MGDANDTAATTCMWDDTDCKMGDWGTRITDVEYISVPFVQWGNIVVLLWTLLLAFSTKYVFSLPFVLFDKKTKKQRQAYRVDQREKRDAKKRRMKKLRAKVATMGGLGSLAKFAVGASGEAKNNKDSGGHDSASSGNKGVELRSLSPTSTPNSDDAATYSDVAVTISDIDTKFPVWRSFDHQIVLSDNKAMCIAYSAFVVATMLACSGSRIPLDYDDDPLQSLMDFLLYSTLTYMLLMIACVLQSKILLIKLNVRQELLRCNVSVGLTFGGVAIASAINLRASMMGSPSSQSFLETIGVTIMYFVMGQICVLLFGWVFQIITIYDDQKEALANNAAAGIKWSSNLIALSVISSAPIERTSELASFWTFTALGSVFLIMFDFFVSYLLVPGNLMQEISKDQNWGYALICAAILLTTAMSFEAIMKDLPCPGSDEWDKYIASFVVPVGDAAAAAAGNSTR